MPASASSSTTASNRSSCTSVNGLSGSSATAQWVNTPSRSSSGRPSISRATVQGVGRGHPDAVHPGVDLEVDPDHLALLAGRGGQRSAEATECTQTRRS